jgi:hypothetical protein
MFNRPLFKERIVWPPRRPLWAQLGGWLRGLGQ